MSTPGFPDFQRLQQSVGAEVLVCSQVVNATFTSPVLSMGAFGYVNMAAQLQGLADYYEVLLSWMTDRSGAQTVATQTIILVPSGNNAIQVPVITPWLQVQIRNWNGVDTAPITVSFYGTNAMSPNLSIADGFAPFIQFNGPIAAGVTDTVNASTLYSGPASWGVACGTTGAWHAHLDFYSVQTASWIIMFEVHSAQFGQNSVLDVRLPPVPVRMVIVNDGTASATFFGAVVAGNGY